MTRLEELAEAKHKMLAQRAESLGFVLSPPATIGYTAEGRPIQAFNIRTKEGRLVFGGRALFNMVACLAGIEAGMAVGRQTERESGR